MPDYDPSNIFARILRGELPCQKVYEDDHTLVIMDIMPRVEGHALIVPKTPSRNFLDMAPADIATLYATVQKVARAAKAAFQADGITIQQFNEQAGGQQVFHTHVHVLPRHEGDRLKPAATEMASSEALEASAAKLRAALGSAGGR